MLIGEQVAALMAEKGWSYAEVARRVNAAGAKNVKYQHIQQLVTHPNRRPAFLVELAAAFGMSAEQFIGKKGPAHIHGKGGVNVSTSSQPARSDWHKMRDAQVLLRHLGELRGVPELEQNPQALTIAYDFLLEFDTSMEESNVLDLTKKLAAKLRGMDDDDEGTKGESQAS